MHITKIELEDIKSHVDSTFEFERGTTAILGENGAGKTTLIEAVAWTLFDFLDYKKDDFVRRGAKKGVAKVTFESSLDERRYVVFRDTKTSYYVYDPALKIRIADKKEEVTRFLWQHLGAEAGTDLESLFRRAIGVPQGTFTAIFLESPTERKRAFDKLLKVEEYRESADKLRDTAKYIDGKIITAREQIARSEGELAGFEKLEENFKSILKEAKKLDISMKKLEAEGTGKQKIVEKFEKVESKVSVLKNELAALENEKSKSEFVLSQKEKERSQAKEAATKIKEVENDYASHVKALGMLKELERERFEREKLRSEMAKVDAAIVKVKSEQKVTNDEKRKVRSAHREIKELTPKIGEQEKFEKQREDLRNLIADAKSAESQIKTLDDRIAKLREQYRENQQQKKEAEEKSGEAKHLDKRQKRDDELRKQLAALNAKLERDQTFQDEIRDGLCPILSEKCLNLVEGQSLEDFVSTQFSGLKLEIGKLEKQHVELATSLRLSREADKFAAKLDSLKKREEEISSDGLTLKKERESFKDTAPDIVKLQKELADVETKLDALDNPKGKVKLLEEQTAQEISLREKTTNIESNLERLESDRRLKIEQLESYKDLDSNWKEFSSNRDETAPAHRVYLANEATAKSLPEKEKELELSHKKIIDLKGNLKNAKEKFEKESAGFDSERYTIEKQELANIEKELIEIRLNRQHLKKQETDLASEIKRLKKTRKLLKKEFREKDRLEKVSGVTAFIRATLKEAAPRVARNYVYHVSIEANQMFRDITGNAERTLRWADDYGIMLEEDGHERPFQNLSGGEQMVAALSVRLAILKQLSDLRIAFFDEPTMNMDAERREGLAEEISQVTERQTFDQLFVISHDDTFENYVDNVVIVRKEDRNTFKLAS